MDAGLVTRAQHGDEEAFASLAVALSRRSAMSMLPLSSVFTTTTFIPAITALAGFVPCAE